MENSVIHEKNDAQYTWFYFGMLILISVAVGYTLLSPLQNFGNKTFGIAGFIFFNLVIYWILRNFEDTLLFLGTFFMAFLIEKHFGTQFYRQKYMIYNPTITFTDMMTVIMLCLWFIKTITKKETLAFKPQFVLRILLLLTAIAISTKNAVEPFQARVGLYTYLKGFVLFLFFQNYLKKRHQFIIVLVALTIGGSLQGLLGIVQQAAHSNFGFVSTHAFEHSEFRVVGTLASPARYAQVLNYLFFIPLGAILIAKKSMVRHLAFVGFGLILAGILFSFARTTWAASFIGAVVVIFMLRKRVRYANVKTILLFTWLTVLGSLMFGYIYFDKISERLDQLEERGDNLEKSRIVRGKISLNMIEMYPYFGVGINNATENYLKFDYDGELYAPKANLSYVHNNYLLFGSEIGLVGFIGFYLLIFTMMKIAWRLRKSQDNIIALVATFIFASYISYLISGLTVAYVGNPFVTFFWFYLAIIAALNKMEHQREKSEIPL